MDTVASVLKELKSLGSEQIRKIHINHGAPIDCWGVKVGDMKPIVKRIKKNYQLALDLFDSGNSDAMYLAGLIGDEKRMTKADLNRWAETSTWSMISEYSVPFVASETSFGWDLALEWIESKKETVVASGWATLSGIVAILPDESLDFKSIDKLLLFIQKNIRKAPNRVRYTMNGFLISLGGYVVSYTDKVKQLAHQLGELYVDAGNTACKVPDVISYLKKMEVRGTIGKKRKTIRC